jgi:glycosyltransferase involved in cell wall biosynthesis
MKIAICSSFVPFLYGGSRNIVDWLESTFQTLGHEVERIYLPHDDSPELLFHQMMAYRWIDLSSADRLICMRPPAHVIPHPNKILWFIHHIRVFYDLWNTSYRPFPDNAKFRGLREALFDADTAALKESKKIFTNSKTVSDRLKQYNHIDSEVLYPPILEPERFSCRSANDEIVCVSRVEHHKRQHLLVEAMRFTKTPVRLRLCGTGDLEYAAEIRALIDCHKLRKKVTLDHRWIDEEKKVEVLAACLAAAYLPIDEDSYGYPSLEASHSSKPILTANDSGGVMELVQDGVNGLVVDPSPRALAEAMDRLFIDSEASRRMGENANARLSELNISWPRVVERLLG